MLGKLIKYEFKATYKFMVMLYGILLALSVILALSLRLNIADIINSFSREFNIGGLLVLVIAVLFMILFGIISAAVLCGMFFYSIVRFKNNLLGNEGYLMHTLPVRESQNIISKLIVSVVWTLAGVLALIISYGSILLIVSSSNTVSNLFSALRDPKVFFLYPHNLIPQLALYAVEIALCCLASLLFMYTHIYASMAVGYSFNSHMALISVGVYIAVKIVFSIIEAVAIIPFRYAGMFDTKIAAMHFPLIFSIVTNIIGAVVLYIVTNCFMTKKLNLQ